jgi:hypothetical protein
MSLLCDADEADLFHYVRGAQIVEIRTNPQFREALLPYESMLKNMVLYTGRTDETSRASPCYSDEHCRMLARRIHEEFLQSVSTERRGKT